MTAPARLAMWSGPRNISTALMRSWENRSDSVVVDEPFYAYYLASTGLDHPGRDDVLAAGRTDWREVVDVLMAPQPQAVRVQYQKQMAHHLLPEIDRDWLAGVTSVLLIRDPGEVVASYVRARDSVTPLDIGLPQQASLYDDLAAAGRTPLVIDAADFLREPEPYLRRLCDEIEVTFEPAMLQWPAGRRESDGVWAPHWYTAVEASTGFAPYHPRKVDLRGAAAEVVAECRPAYERLHAMRWLP